MPRKRRARVFALKPEPSPGECRLLENGAACRRTVGHRGLCMLHYNYLLLSGELDRFALPSRVRSGGVGPGGERIVSRNPAPAAGMCLVVDRGAPCSRPARVRGVCQVHDKYLRRNGLLDELALPATKHTAPPRLDLRRDHEAREGRCAVLVGGVPCPEGAYGTTYALCERHQKLFWGRSAEALDEYRIPEVGVRYARKKTVDRGTCVVREWSETRGYFPCERPPSKRGVCTHHMWVLRLDTRTFEQVANPLPRRHVELRPRARKPGACVAVENGRGCPERAWRTYGVCARHYSYLKKHGRTAELERRRVELARAVRARRPESEWRLGFCILTIDGVPCRRAELQRGLCKACYTALWRTPLLDELARPSARACERVLERVPKIVPGVCVARENGEPCEHGSVARGLCRTHYRLAQELGTLDELGLSEDEVRSLSPIPAAYFAPDVVLRFVDQEVFGTTTERSAVALVSAVLARSLRATVSFETVRAVYAHVGHRLARPSVEGGRGVAEVDAEGEARRYTGELFFGRNGLWHVVPYAEEDVRLLTSGGRLSGVSLEDAIEIHCYARAKTTDRVSFFVTSSTEVVRYAEGVHPVRVASALGLVSR
jgi:hypothetical protein